MKYHLENDFDQDKFGIHTKISETLYDIISDTDLDLSKGSFTIGLFGKWGSGKSLIIDLFEKNHLNKNPSLVYIYLDVWKYVDTSLYRSVLFDIEKQLKNSKNYDVCQHYKEKGYQYKNNSLEDILSRDIKIEEEIEIKVDSKLKGVKLLKHRWNKLLVFIKKYKWFFLFLTIILSIKVCSQIYNWKLMKEIFGTLFQFFIVIGGIKVFEDVFKNIGSGFIPKPTVRVVSSPPTFSQDQFENIFKDMIKQTLESIHQGVNNKKVVIVFDNIDRCEPQISYQTLTGLRTFMESKNCVYIIPCDDKEILNHLHNNNNGLTSDFMDKIFQTYMRIPILEEFDRDIFIDELLEDCIVEFNPEKDLGVIKSILYKGYRGQTPRQIKRFVNDYQTYYRLIKKIDPKEEVLLKDIQIFTFFIVIKQVYPEVESLFVEYSDFFGSMSDGHPLFTSLRTKYINDGKSEDKSGKLMMEFKKFILSFKDRLKLDEIIEPLNYVFLKTDLKFDIIRLKQDLINQSDEIKLTNESPELLVTIFDKFIEKKENPFLEDSISHLVQIIIDEPAEPIIEGQVDIFRLDENGNKIESVREEILDKIFKVLWSYKDDVPESQIKENVDLIKVKLNTILEFSPSEITKTFIHLIRFMFENDYEKNYQEFFDVILLKITPQEFSKCFNMEIEQVINLPEEDITTNTPLPYLTSSSLENITGYIPDEYIDHLMILLSFTEEDEDILDFLLLYIGPSGLLDEKVRTPLSESIQKELVPIQNHNGRHPKDDFILNHFKTLSSVHDYSPEFYNSLFHRITFLMNQNLLDPGYEYYKVGLHLLKSDQHKQNLLTWFNSHILFSHQSYFPQFFNSLQQDDIELFLINDELKNILLVRIGQYNYWEDFYSKLDSVFILDYHTYIITDDTINPIIYMIKRIDDFTDQRLNKVRYRLIGELLNFDIGSYRQLIDEILSLTISGENKLNYMFKVINHFLEDVTNEQDDICKYLDKLKRMRSQLDSKQKRTLTRQVNQWKTEYKDTKFIVRVNNKLKNFKK